MGMSMRMIVFFFVVAVLHSPPVHGQGSEIADDGSLHAGLCVHLHFARPSPVCVRSANHVRCILYICTVLVCTMVRTANSFYNDRTAGCRSSTHLLVILGNTVLCGLDFMALLGEAWNPPRRRMEA